MVLGLAGGKGVGKEKFGEFALAEGDDVLGLSVAECVCGGGSGTFEPSWLSDCICMHWPRYIRDSLILPASASVAPAVFAFRARSEPAKSTMVSVLLDQGPFRSMSRFLTSTQKKPWLRELTALLPVPATLRSVRPVSSTIMASSKLPQMILVSPATTFRSGLCSVLLKRSARRLTLGCLFFIALPLNRSKMRSLYTSYIEITMAYSALVSVGIATSATDGFCGRVDGRGILFDREVPPMENMLLSFLAGELISAVDREMSDRAPFTGRIECMPALGRLEKVA